MEEGVDLREESFYEVPLGPKALTSARPRVIGKVVALNPAEQRLVHIDRLLSLLGFVCLRLISFNALLVGGQQELFNLQCDVNHVASDRI